MHQNQKLYLWWISYLHLPVSQRLHVTPRMMDVWTGRLLQVSQATPWVCFIDWSAAIKWTKKGFLQVRIKGLFCLFCSICSLNSAGSEGDEGFLFRSDIWHSCRHGRQCRVLWRGHWVTPIHNRAKWKCRSNDERDENTPFSGNNGTGWPGCAGSPPHLVGGKGEHLVR